MRFGDSILEREMLISRINCSTDSFLKQCALFSNNVNHVSFENDCWLLEGWQAILDTAASRSSFSIFSRNLSFMSAGGGIRLAFIKCLHVVSTTPTFPVLEARMIIQR
uniref:Uncharacterized protein n=1 Tax=Opuntia streptacantha TaxID=393608 RepID=A0A7C9D8S7_OPUST